MDEFVGGRASDCSKKDFFVKTYLTVLNIDNIFLMYMYFYVCLDLFSIDAFEDHDKALD